MFTKSASFLSPHKQCNKDIINPVVFQLYLFIQLKQRRHLMKSKTFELELCCLFMMGFLNLN